MYKISNTITGAEIQVALNDFSEEMSWQEAKRECNELGSGWRLPTYEELKAIYGQLHKKGQGNFKSDFYFSSRVYDNNDVLVFSFRTGDYNYFQTKYPKANVRAVRDL